MFLAHQHGRRFIVLEHQYGCRDVMWKRSIEFPLSFVWRHFAGKPVVAGVAKYVGRSLGLFKFCVMSSIVS